MEGIMMSLTNDKSLSNKLIKRTMKVVLYPSVQAQHLVGRNAVKSEDSHHFSFRVVHRKFSM